MRIAIFGCGGVGGYFGGRLAQAGEQVFFIARGQHLQALQQRGLQVRSINGDFNLPVVEVTDDPREIGPVDVILVSVKSWQVPDTIKALSPLVGSDTLIVPLLNGVEAPLQFVDAYGEANVLGGLAKIISSISAPGQIDHVGAEPYIAFGELDNRPSERCTKLRQAFENAGITVDIPADIQIALWEKFLFVVGWGAVGAITGSAIGEIRSEARTRSMLDQSMREIFEVALACGIELPDDLVAQTLAFLDTLPDGGTTSLQRDVIDGRPSELASWSGAVVRLGSEAGVPTPLHDFVYSSLLLRENRVRGAEFA